MGRCKQKQRGLRGLLCRWPSITEWEVHITAQDDLYCVEWDVNLYYTIPSIVPDWHCAARLCRPWHRWTVLKRANIPQQLLSPDSLIGSRICSVVAVPLTLPPTVCQIRNWKALRMITCWARPFQWPYAAVPRQVPEDVVTWSNGPGTRYLWTKCTEYRRRTQTDSSVTEKTLTDERLKQSTLEDAHDAFDSKSQRTIVWTSQSAVIFFQQFQCSMSFYTQHAHRRYSYCAV